MSAKSTAPQRAAQPDRGRSRAEGSIPCGVGTIVALVALLGMADLSDAQPAASAGEPCESGWVWREAFAGDYICVRPQVRQQVWADNEAAASRYAPGAYGPATCRTGFVWREAVPGDVVCVPPASRDLVRAENAAHVRIEAPITSRRPLRGRCKDGYLERRAHPKDDYCVSPEAHQRVLEENALGPSRRGGDACIAGYVWREASPEDRVCVDPSQREQARADNRDHPGRVLSGICAAYAKEAVALFNEMTARNCGLSGRAWSPDYAWHEQLCFHTSAGGRDQEADRRRSELQACTASPRRELPPGEQCLFSVEIRQLHCLNHDGTPASVSPDGYSATSCGGTVENARVRARATFTSQLGAIAEDDPPTEPGSCSVTEDVTQACLCS